MERWRKGGLRGCITSQSHKGCKSKKQHPWALPILAAITEITQPLFLVSIYFPPQKIIHIKINTIAWEFKPFIFYWKIILTWPPQATFLHKDCPWDEWPNCCLLETDSGGSDLYLDLLQIVLPSPAFFSLHAWSKGFPETLCALDMGQRNGWRGRVGGGAKRCSGYFKTSVPFSFEE